MLRLAGYVDKHNYEFVTTQPDKSRPVRYVFVYSAFGVPIGSSNLRVHKLSRNVYKQSTL